MMRAQDVAGENPFGEAEVAYRELVHRLQSPETMTMRHEAVEIVVLGEGRELLRRLYQAHLDMRGPGDVGPSVVGSDGVERKEKRLRSRSLGTIVGEVTVNRYGYGAPGASSLFPLDAELGLPREKYSYGVRRHVAEWAAKGSFDEVVQDVGTTTGAKVAKRQVEELAARAATDFDEFYAERQRDASEAKKSGSVLVISSDGKGVVMRQEGLRPATREAAESRSHKLSSRLSPGEKRGAKRMSTVGAVYTIAPFVRTPDDIQRELRGDSDKTKPRRPRPEHKRVWASLEKSSSEVIEDAFQEGLTRDPERAKTWVGLVDGNRAQIGQLKETAARHRVALIIILDVIHVIEYLWRAAWVLHAKERAEAAEKWVTERLRWILEGRSSQVAAGMRRAATRRGLRRQQRKPLDDAARYLLNNRAYLRYDEYLAKGLPIATGVIEGACRHLVKDRMDITGARWSLSGAEAVLRLRSLRASHDFDDYWRLHLERERAANHDVHYANLEVPQIRRDQPKSASHLQLRLVRGGKQVPS
jgi:hypothetical protein